MPPFVVVIQSRQNRVRETSVYLQVVDDAGSREVVGVEDYALTFVESGDCHHLVIGEGEIEDIEVLGHAFLADGLGDDDDVALVEPAEDYLTDRLAMTLGYFLQHGVGEESVLTLGKRRPCLLLDALGGEEVMCCHLREIWIGLHLVYHRLYLVVEDEVKQALVGEACHTDCTHTTFLIQLLQGTPGGVVVVVGFVQQI